MLLATFSHFVAKYVNVMARWVWEMLSYPIVRRVITLHSCHDSLGCTRLGGRGRMRGSNAAEGM